MMQAQWVHPMRYVFFCADFFRGFLLDRGPFFGFALGLAFRVLSDGLFSFLDTGPASSFLNKSSPGQLTGSL
jgi:hypothetical protein